METALKGLEKTIAAGRLKDRNKMERRLGKIQARHPQVNDLYDVALKDTAEGVRLFWQIKEDRKSWRESREGAYLLRTNLQAETAEELCSKYMQLTEAEASFRALKSELSIRPLFHQLEPRVKAHVMVAFLGYALWVTLKHLLKRSRSDGCSAESAKRRHGVENRPADDADEGDRIALHAAKRGHRSTDHGWPGDSPAADYGANGRAETTAPAVGHQPATTSPVPSRM